MNKTEKLDAITKIAKNAEICAEAKVAEIGTILNAPEDRTEEVRLFKYEELSDTAKHRAHADWLNKGYEYPFWGEARDTIKAFEREFNVRIYNWEYSSCGYHFRLDFGSVDESALRLSGNRARAYLWNNHEDVLLKPRTRYFTRIDGKRVEAVAVDSVKHKSKIEFDRVYNGTCPWTGTWLDNEALDPLAYFCFGVEWSDKEKKRVPSARALAHDNATTVESVIRDCADALFAALKSDCEYCESEEAFAETCEANGYEFTESGEMW